MRFFLVLFFVLITYYGQAQVSVRTIIRGKINANTTDLEGIYVINLNTEKSMITEKEGYFSINAMFGDTLLFSAVNLKEMRVALKEEDFKKEFFFVKMESSLFALNEIVIKRYDNINAVSLGISPSGIIYLSPAVRKYNSASGGIGLVPLLNLISGRSVMLKKGIAVEEKLQFIQQIDNMFDENYFIKNWKIPSEYVDGFKYYVVENVDFTNVLKQKNKTTIDFLLGELAIKYNKIIACEHE